MIKAYFIRRAANKIRGKLRLMSSFDKVLKLSPADFNLRGEHARRTRAYADRKGRRIIDEMAVKNHRKGIHYCRVARTTDVNVAVQPMYKSIPHLESVPSGSDAERKVALTKIAYYLAEKYGFHDDTPEGYWARAEQLIKNSGASTYIMCMAKLPVIMEINKDGKEEPQL